MTKIVGVGVHQYSHISCVLSSFNHLPEVFFREIDVATCRLWPSSHQIIKVSSQIAIEAINFIDIFLRLLGIALHLSLSDCQKRAVLSLLEVQKLRK